MPLIIDGRLEHYLWIALSVMYCGICLLVVTQLIRIVYFRHRLYSFQGVFLLLCLVWTAFRAVFWMSDTSQWHIWVELLIYWIPNVVQFSTFSLLVLFYCKLVNQHNWEKKKYNIYRSLFAMNLLIILLTLLWIWLSRDYKDNYTIDFIYSLFSGFVFATLVVMIAWYGWKVYQLQVPRVRHPFASTAAMFGLTFLVFSVFLTRSTYGFIQACGGWVMHVPVGDSRIGNSQAVDLPTFLVLCLWEVFPTASVVLYFRQVPPTDFTLLDAIRSKLCQSAECKEPLKQEKLLPNEYGYQYTTEDEKFFTNTRDSSHVSTQLSDDSSFTDKTEFPENVNRKDTGIRSKNDHFYQSHLNHEITRPIQDHLENSHTRTQHSREIEDDFNVDPSQPNAHMIYEKGLHGTSKSQQIPVSPVNSRCLFHDKGRYDSDSDYETHLASSLVPQSLSNSYNIYTSPEQSFLRFK